jgi:Xaa-Pro aminopeptidase
MAWASIFTSAADRPGGRTLKTGHVVTVEPGLYYLGVGGVRLEDVVVVTARGNHNITDCPQFPGDR